MSNFISEKGNIEIRLREANQLFDSLDPSPFRERDLHRSAEAFIVDSARELPSRAPYALVIELDQPARVAEEARIIGDAIHTHFARRSYFLRRDLRQLIRRGLLSLCIGLAFLVTVFAAAKGINGFMGASGFAELLQESMLILGWVAMWRPLEIFLYDWWPLVNERRLHDRLSRISVQVIHKDSAKQG